MIIVSSSKYVRHIYLDKTTVVLDINHGSVLASLLKWLALNRVKRLHTRKTVWLGIDLDN